jgi:N-acetylglutamate synthase-like GNAT family acetyltransferase
MIRKAVESDIPVLLSYGEFFWMESPYASKGIAYCPQTVERLLQLMIEDHYLLVATVDEVIVGFLGMLISQFPFNDDYQMGSELFFYVHPKHRGSIGSAMMLQAELDLADEVDILSFGDMSSSTDMKEYYDTRGFEMTERCYSKVLE